MNPLDRIPSSLLALGSVVGAFSIALLMWRQFH